MRRAANFGLFALGLAIGISLTAWASAYIWGSPKDTSSEVSEPLLVAVTEDSIGRSIRFSATASWPVEGSVRALRSGTLTSRHSPGTPVAVTSGTHIYSVDLVASTAMEGAVPAFRTMAEGDSGPDVTQLQRFLASQGFYDGDAHGEFDMSTRLSVLSWEADSGYEPDGIVELGQVTFFPDLPVRLAIRNGVEAGVSVVLGFELFDILGATPQFQVSVPIEQSGELESGQEVTLVHFDAEWSAITAGSRTNFQSGSVTWDLGAPTGNGSPCGEDCERLIRTGEPTRILANIVVVEPLTGPSLPVAAIRSSVADRTHIQTPDSKTIPVRVLASDLGVAILDGVDIGQLAVVQRGP